MGCVVCKKGLSEGVTLYRINAKGQPGLWACLKHRSQTDAPVDHELDRIVNALERKAP